MAGVPLREPREAVWVQRDGRVARAYCKLRCQIVANPPPAPMGPPHRPEAHLRRNHRRGPRQRQEALRSQAQPSNQPGSRRNLNRPLPLAHPRQPRPQHQARERRTAQATRSPLSPRWLPPRRYCRHPRHGRTRHLLCLLAAHRREWRPEAYGTEPRSFQHWTARGRGRGD